MQFYIVCLCFIYVGSGVRRWWDVQPNPLTQSLTLPSAISQQGLTRVVCCMFENVGLHYPV